MKEQKHLQIYSIYLGITALACSLWAALIPGEGGGMLFGMTAARFGIVSTLFIIGFACLVFTFNFKNSPGVLARFGKARSLISKRALSVLAFLGAYAGVIALITYALFASFAWARVLQRLLPVTTFLLTAGIGYAVLLKQERDKERAIFSRHELVILVSVAGLFCLILLGAFVWQFGLTSEPGGWMTGLPVPLYPSQAGLLFLAGLFCSWLFGNIKLLNSNNTVIIDVLIGICLWGTAFYIWSGYKFPNTYFLPRPMPPTMQLFPFSDARLYDRAAYSILTGEMGINLRIPDHPLYPFFLSLMHALSGDRYQNVINSQMVFLAAFPAALYFLGKRMSGRLAGIFAAGYVIMREANTLSVSSLVLTSNVKLYMTELPAALLFSITCVLLVEQLNHPEYQKWKWMLIGALFGGAVLLRLQSVVLLLTSLVAITLILCKEKRFIRPILFLVCGFLFILAPWIVRNYRITGSVVIDNPRAISQATALVSTDITEKESRDVQVNISGALGTSLSAILENPLRYIKQTLNHFAHSEMVSLYAFPVLAQPMDGIDTLLSPPLFYWSGQEEPNPDKDLPAISFVILVISLGAMVAYHKVGWSSLMPLLFHFSYNLSSALVRFSGWRFGLPVDWILLLYGAVGLAWIAEKTILFFQENKTKLQTETIHHAVSLTAEKKSFLLVGMILFGIGFMFPLTSALLAKYPKTEQRILVSEITAMQTLTDSDKRAMLGDESQTILKGISLYPRYYQAGQGEPSSDLFYKARDYARLLFVYIGSDNLDVEFASVEIPEKIRHAREIIMGGRLDGKFFFADWILLLTDEPIVYFRDGV